MGLKKVNDHIAMPLRVVPGGFQKGCEMLAVMLKKRNSINKTYISTCVVYKKCVPLHPQKGEDCAGLTINSLKKNALDSVGREFYVRSLLCVCLLRIITHTYFIYITQLN